MHIFSWFYTMYIALGQGQTTHKGLHFYVNRKASSLSLHFIHIPRGQNFYVNRNLLSLRSLATSFKKNLFDFIEFFFMIFLWEKGNMNNGYFRNYCSLWCQSGRRSSLKLSRLMRKPTKWLCTQQRLRSAWASAQSDQSLRCALNG